MKKLLNLILITTVLCSVLLPFHVKAQTPSLDYQPLAPIAPLEADLRANRTDDSFSDYLNGMFRLGIGIASALAVIMIVFGGIRYMSTDSVTGKKDGLGYVNSAVGGLLLLIFSWLILRTLNPALLSSSLILDDSPVGKETLIPTNERRPLTNAERLNNALENENVRDEARKELVEEIASDLEFDGIEATLFNRMLGSRDASFGRLELYLVNADAVYDAYFDQIFRSKFEQEKAQQDITDLQVRMLNQYIGEKDEIETIIRETDNINLKSLGEQILQQLLDRRNYIFEEMALLRKALI